MSVGAVRPGSYESSHSVLCEGSSESIELVAAKTQPAGLSRETVLLLGQEPVVHATTKIWDAGGGWKE